MNLWDRLSRLIHLIEEAMERWDAYLDDCQEEEIEPMSFEHFIAQRLLENGIIVPPCKVGDTVYMVVNRCTYLKLQSRTYAHVRRSKVTPRNFIFIVDNFGNDVFLTREEAEAEAEKRNKEDHHEREKVR